MTYMLYWNLEFFIFAFEYVNKMVKKCCDNVLFIKHAKLRFDHLTADLLFLYKYPKFFPLIYDGSLSRILIE